MLALKWFSTYFTEIFTFLILNSFKTKKFQKINFYLFLNIYFNLYKKTNISKTFSKYFLSNTNEFNMFLFIYLIWTSSCLLNGKSNWFLLLLLLNSKNYKIKINSTSNIYSNFIKNNPLKPVITNKLHLLKKNFFKSFNYIKFEKFLSHSFVMFPIKFKPSNILFFLSQSTFKKLNINFIRKSKVFNKGRYSRNRQYYRTGVYWCLYINIILVVSLYFWFYRFLINFGYLWWLLFAFILSFVFPKFFGIYKMGFFKNYIAEELVWFEQIFFTLLNTLSFSKKDILFCDILLSKITCKKLFFFDLNN